MNPIEYFFQYIVFFYTLLIIFFYSGLAIFGYLNILRSKIKYTEKEEEELKSSAEMAPGISIVAPAFNEEVIIINNALSFLNLDYPNFEVVIVNDGSEDDTLELLINYFELEEISFPYIQKVYCQPVKKIYRSRNELYHRLIVVDKENGGTKADAINAGINIAQHDYFINTDVDCILAPDTLSKVMLPVLDSDKRVIAVGATMRMVNGCDIEDGQIIRVRPPRRVIPLFQETEYLRSYLLAKMGWSMFNLIPNISGGFGLFDKEVVINVGGLDPVSHAEDMDITIRMVKYMKENKEKYKIIQIPDTCCWTEGPPNIKVLQRQRSRWGRGLLQIFAVHRKVLFNPKYGRLGLFILPYALIFEFLAPLIVLNGIGFVIFLILTKQINYQTFWLMLGLVYLMGITFSLLTITYDIIIKKQYKTYREYIRLVLFSSIEAFIYYPLIVIFNIIGYIQFLTRKNFKWGEMTRQGHAEITKVETH